MPVWPSTILYGPNQVEGFTQYHSLQIGKCFFLELGSVVMAARSTWLRLLQPFFFVVLPFYFTLCLPSGLLVPQSVEIGGPSSLWAGVRFRMAQMISAVTVTLTLRTKFAVLHEWWVEGGVRHERGPESLAHWFSVVDPGCIGLQKRPEVQIHARILPMLFCAAPLRGLKRNMPPWRLPGAQHTPSAPRAGIGPLLFYKSP